MGLHGPVSVVWRIKIKEWWYTSTYIARMKECKVEKNILI